MHPLAFLHTCTAQLSGLFDVWLDDDDDDDDGCFIVSDRQQELGSKRQGRKFG